MNENLNRLIEMLEPKTKRMTQKSTIESLADLNIKEDAKVDFEVSKKAVTVNIETDLNGFTEHVTYNLKQNK